MPFWDIFKKDNSKGQYNCSIHEELAIHLPNISENELIKLACCAGLFARVAYVDFHYHPDEIKKMAEVLKTMKILEEHQINPVIELATSKIKELSGIENHKYCKKLNELMNNEEKHRILQALFAIAASDNSVEQLESAEIRLITQGLCLPHQNYIAARAEVLNKLKVLNIT